MDWGLSFFHFQGKSDKAFDQSTAAIFEGGVHNRNDRLRSAGLSGIALQGWSPK